ncbi:hypothetical protein LAZ67_2007009 [Cordylochernes scorpioides]|uniref:Major facilitator superfamily (MFS) profile domain-containing protein n=1 Tax=Cordylochernes scorpioides TaxID=51811 RepID=A0ABY6K5R0_9ARAC|nr:hypothetical protein LAZ67_2007009 [Cordylochernes scorpioides]
MDLDSASSTTTTTESLDVPSQETSPKNEDSLSTKDIMSGHQEQNLEETELAKFLELEENENLDLLAGQMQEDTKNTLPQEPSANGDHPTEGRDYVAVTLPEDSCSRTSLHSWRGHLSVLAGFLIHLTLGSYYYSFGNLNTYMTSYLRARVDPTMTYSKTMWVNACVMIGQGIFMMIGGWVNCILGDRFTAMIGCTIFSLGSLLTTYTLNVSFPAVSVTFGLLASSGLGMAYVVPLVNGMKWFPKSKGTVNGVIVAGYGLGALFLNYFQTSYLNPDNLPTDPDGYFTTDTILDKVPQIFLITGLTYLCIQCVALFLMSEPAQPSPPCPSLLEDELETEPMVSSPCRRKALTPMEMLRTKEFYLLWVTFGLTAQCVQYTNTMYKIWSLITLSAMSLNLKRLHFPEESVEGFVLIISCVQAFGQLFIHNDRFLSTVGALAALSNCGGRLIWGLLLDRTSYKSCMLLLTCLLSCFMLTFSATPYGKEFMYIVWVLGAYFSFSGLFVVFPTAIAKFFGPSHCGTNFGILFTAPAFSSFIATFFVVQIQNNFGYAYSFILVGSFSVIAFFITLFFPEIPEVSYKSN